MKTLISTHWITLDGYVAGPDDSMEWILADDDMMTYENDLVASADTLLLGRITYGDFAGYWPAVAEQPDAEPGQKRYAKRLNQLRKVVFSRMLDAPVWDKTDILSDVTAAAVKKLKQGDGKIVTYGSVSIVRQLAKLGLIDEFHLLVHPIVLGKGKPLLQEKTQLKHVRTQMFGSGVALAVYRPQPR